MIDLRNLYCSLLTLEVMMKSQASDLMHKMVS